MSLSVRSVLSNYGMPPPSLWTLAQKIGMKKPVSVRDLITRLEPAEYCVSMPSFRVNMMRSGSWLGKTESDTDHVNMSVKVNGGPILTQTQFVGDQKGGPVNVGLTVPSFTVLATDQVYIQYSIMNSGGNPGDVKAFLENAASQILNAAWEYDKKIIGSVLPGPLSSLLSKLTPQEQGAIMGAQLGYAVGATVGGVVLPGLGVVIGALAGWFANNLLGFAFPSCDGPVAAAVYIYNGAQLRDLTNGGAYTQTDKNPGVNSATGCGANSDYDVTWCLSKV